jgi:hypothetical protein
MTWRRTGSGSGFSWPSRRACSPRRAGQVFQRLLTRQAAIHMLAQGILILGGQTSRQQFA